MLNGLTITYVVVTSKIPGNANNEPPNVEHEGGGEGEGVFINEAISPEPSVCSDCIFIECHGGRRKRKKKEKRKK